MYPRLSASVVRLLMGAEFHEMVESIAYADL